MNAIGTSTAAIQSSLFITALFILGVICGAVISEEERLDTQLKRDVSYVIAMVFGSLLIMLLDAITVAHVHPIAFVVGVLGWAVWDDFFSEEHGRYRHGRDRSDPNALNPNEHRGHQPFA